MSQRKASAVREQIILCDPEIMSGQPVFAGTRVPAKALFDVLAAGRPLAEFEEGFPTVERRQAVELLRRIGDLIDSGELIA